MRKVLPVWRILVVFMHAACAFVCVRIVSGVKGLQDAWWQN